MAIKSLKNLKIDRENKIIPGIINIGGARGESEAAEENWNQRKGGNDYCVMRERWRGLAVSGEGGYGGAGIEKNLDLMGT